jgi:zinc transport system substrate-binding protein
MKKNLLFCCSILIISQTSLFAGEKILAFVSVGPQKYLVEKIGGNQVDVQVMVPPGREPHDFTPTPGQMMKLGQAKIYFSVGMPFEQAILKKVKGMGLKLEIRDMAEGVKKVAIEKHIYSFSEEKEHSQDHGDHDHSDLDPHIWLSPSCLEKMADNTCSELSEFAPKKAEAFKKNLIKFKQQLQAVNAEIKKELEPFKGKVFYVFHPAFGYFASSYDLHQATVEIEGKKPGARTINNLIKQAKAQNIKTIFIQPQFNKRAAEAIANGIGGSTQTLNPLAENVLENLKITAAKLASAFKERK